MLCASCCAFGCVDTPCSESFEDALNPDRSTLLNTVQCFSSRPAFRLGEATAVASPAAAVYALPVSTCFCECVAVIENYTQTHTKLKPQDCACA